MIAVMGSSRVQENFIGCLIEYRGWLGSSGLTLLVSPNWCPDVDFAANTVGDQAGRKLAASRRCRFSSAAIARAVLVCGFELRHSRGRLEPDSFCGEYRRHSVVPMFDQCQAIRDMLLLEKLCGSYGRLLFDSQIVRGDNRIDQAQVGGMLLHEEGGQTRSGLKVETAREKERSRMEIMRLRSD